MKLIIFTTCKPFIGDDAKRQEQALKSWTLLDGIEKQIIIIGNDLGTKQICDKYNFIHEPIVKNLNGVPYLYSMFEIANKYANDDDVMMWTNSDIIYFNKISHCIKWFKENFNSIKNYLLIGGRLDWKNPSLLPELTEKHFFNNINLQKSNKKNMAELYNSSKYECEPHLLCGIDYVIHSNTTFINNIDKNLVIAGTRHDMILVGAGIQKKYFTCDITDVCPIIHQNHGCPNKALVNSLKLNNSRCYGIQKGINNSTYKMVLENGNLKIIKR